MDDSVFDGDLSEAPSRDLLEADYESPPDDSQIPELVLVEGAVEADGADDEGSGLDIGYDFQEPGALSDNEPVGALTPMKAKMEVEGNEEEPETPVKNLMEVGGFQTPGKDEPDDQESSPLIQTPPDASFGQVGSDCEEEPEPMHEPRYYELKQAMGCEPTDWPGEIDGEEEDSVAQAEAHLEAEEALLAAQVEDQLEAAETEVVAKSGAESEEQVDGVELVRQVSDGIGAMLIGPQPLNRAGDSSSREPEYEEGMVVEKQPPEPVHPVEPEEDGEVKFQRVPSRREGGRWVLVFAGYSYSINRPYKGNQPAHLQRWRMRCSSHESCDVAFFVDGNDQLLEIDSIPTHQCGRPDYKEIMREIIKGAIRTKIKECMDDGKFYRFNMEVSIVYHKFSDAELRLADFSVQDAQAYGYEVSRWKKCLPTPPKDIHFSWPTNTSFLMRDPTHCGEKRSILLYDSEVFEFTSKSRVEKCGRVVVFGGDFIRSYLDVIDGCLVDGTYYTAAKGWAQSFNIMFRLILKRDKGGKPVKVAFVHGFSALLSSHDFAVYVKLFEWMKTWIPDWKPAFVMADFEMAATSAFRAVWQNVAKLSCRFHFSKALSDKISHYGIMKQFMECGTSRRKLRFVLACAYLPEELVHQVLERFLVKIAPKDDEELDVFDLHVLPYLERTWIGKLLQPSVPAQGKYKAIPATWKKAIYPVEAWNRHQATLEGYPTSSNALEGFHSTIKRFTGPSPGLWNYADLMGSVLELNAGRLRKIDQLFKDGEEKVALDSLLDSYDVEFVGDDAQGFDVRSIQDFNELSPAKAAKRFPSKCKWIRGVSETSVRLLKANPVAEEYVAQRVGEEKVLVTGYLPLAEARKDMEKPFVCLEEAVRKWPAYSSSADLNYLFARKVGCLVSGFGTPAPFRMTKMEQKVFAVHNGQWNASDAPFYPSGDVEEADSDCEGVAKHAEEFLAQQRRRESLALGEAAGADSDEQGKAKAKGGKGCKAKEVAKKKGDKAKEVAKKKGDKAKEVAKKKDGKDKEASESANKKTGAKAEEVAKNKKGDKAKEVAKKKKKAEVKKVKFDPSKTDHSVKSPPRAPSSKAGFSKNRVIFSDSEDDALPLSTIKSKKRLSGGKKDTPPQKKLALGSDVAGPSHAVLEPEAEEVEEGPEVPVVPDAPVEKRKKKRKSVPKFSPKFLRSTSLLGKK